MRHREMSSAGIPEAPEAVPASITPISGISTCPSCGLSLSASARFCRRCGTQQHQSA
jgi:predicted amidophosphoribosyltransferase